MSGMEIENGYEEQQNLWFCLKQEDAWDKDYNTTIYEIAIYSTFILL